MNLRSVKKINKYDYISFRNHPSINLKQKEVTYYLIQQLNINRIFYINFFIKSVGMAEQTNETSEFILKLIDMLSFYSDIIGWNQNQTQIVVKDSKLLVEIVLPKYFRHSKFESFIRQLNMYNFHKVCRQKNQAIHFKNEIFFKGNQNNFWKIKRKKKNQCKPKNSHLHQSNIKFIEEDDTIPLAYKNVLVRLLNFKELTLYENKRCITLLNSLGDQIKTTKSKKLDPSVPDIKNSFERLSQKSEQIQNILKLIKNRQTDTISLTQKQKLPQSELILKNEHSPYRQSQEDPSTQNTKQKQSVNVATKSKMNIQHYKYNFKLFSIRSITSFIDGYKQQKFIKIEDNKSQFSIELDQEQNQ